MKVGGRYQIVREIGAGGMGRVFQAVDTETGKPVAAKMMVTEGANSLDLLLRFQQEGAVLSTLKHPNIVEVYGTFLVDQTSCIVMELLEGRSLGDILASGESLPRSRIVRLMQQVAAALGYAHARGIVHRDVKPDNIMVMGDDHVKVTDFGIARILGSGATLNTAPGTSIGTPVYMAPEQIEGQQVDGRSDIYSFGSVMYQLVTGHPPFEGDDPITIAFQIVHKAPHPPSSVNAEVPTDWEALILKALAKDPADRFQTAEELSRAVSSLTVESSGGSSGATQIISPMPQKRAPAAPRPEVTSERTPELPVPAVPGSAPILQHPETDREVTAPPSRSVVAVASGAGKSDLAPTTAARPPRIPRLAIATVLLVILVVVAAAVVLSRRAQPQAAPTPPAPLTQLTPGNGIPASAVSVVNQWGSSGSEVGQFLNPSGVVVDGAGNVYVADTGNDRVQELAASTDPVGSWGTPGSEIGQFNLPSGIALDPSGHIYVADTGNNRIQKFGPGGKLLAVWGSQGSGSGEFDRPEGIALDAQGNMYVADTGNNRIQKLSPGGKSLATWGTQGSNLGQFNHPGGVAVDRLGRVYVADTDNNRVQQLASTSDPLNEWGRQGSGSGQFNKPRGVAVDARGHVFVADSGNDRFQELDQTGKVLIASGTAGTSYGGLNNPTSIVVDGEGRVYVVDTGHDRVLEFSVPR
jgi:serine/threonine protein kinase, bacterial